MKPFQDAAVCTPLCVPARGFQAAKPGMVTKTSIMLGLGEKPEVGRGTLAHSLLPH